MEQRPTTIDQLKTFLINQFDNKGTQKRNLLKRYVKEWINFEIKVTRTSTFQSMIDQVYQYVKSNNLLPTTMQNEIEDLMRNNVQNIEDEKIEELKENYKVKKEQILEEAFPKERLEYEYVHNQVMKKQGFDDVYYLHIDVSKFIGENFIPCFLSEEDLINFYENYIEPIFAKVIQDVNAENKCGIQIGVINTAKQYISTNYFYPSQYQDFKDITNALYEKLVYQFNKYQKDFEEQYMPFYGIDFRWLYIEFHTNIKETEQRIGSIWKPIDLQHSKYLFIDTSSRTNCVFNSLFTTIQWLNFYLKFCTKSLDEQYFEQNKLYIYQFLTDSKRRQKRANKFKENNGFFEDYSRKLLSLLDIEYITRQLKVNCILYDNQMQKIQNITHDLKYKYVKLMIFRGVHCIPIISLKELKQIYTEEEIQIIIDCNKTDLQKSLEKHLQKQETQSEETIEQDHDQDRYRLLRTKKRKIDLNEFDFKKHIVSWDVETYTFEQRPNVYLSGLTFYDQDQIKFKNFVSDKTNLQAFWDYVVDNIEFFNNKIFYAHFGGKFDVNLLVRDVLNKDPRCIISDKETREINGKWISFGVCIRIQGKKAGYIEFRDSFNLMPMPLKKVTKSFCKENFKTNLDHRIINMLVQKIGKPDLTQYLEDGSDQRLKDEIEDFMNLAVPYHKLDCDSLFEALCNLDVLFRDSFQMSIYEGKTISSLSKLYYLNRFYKQIEKKYKTKTGEEKIGKFYQFPVYRLSYNQDVFMRQSYKGGMNMCLYYGFIKHKRIFYYDFNSHYPNVGRKSLPYGKPIERMFNNEETHKCSEFSKQISSINFKMNDLNNNQQIDVPRFKCGCHQGIRPEILRTLLGEEEGIFQVIIQGNDKKLKCQTPYISVKDQTNNGILCYPYFNNTRVEVLTRIEIFYAFSLGYDIQVLQGFSFKSAPILKEMFETLYKYKSDAKKDKDECKETMFKLMINSGYGWLGLNTYKSSKIVFTSQRSKEYLEYMQDGQLQSITAWPNNYVLRVGGSYQQNADCNVAIASYITAYARIELHKVINLLHSIGEKVFYCDTDSIITTCNFSDFNTIMKLRKTQTGKILYNLIRPPKTDEKGKIDYDKLGAMKNERGMKNNQDLHFTDGIMVGCKNYALKDQNFIDQLSQHLDNLNYEHYIDEDEFILDREMNKQEITEFIEQQYFKEEKFDPKQNKLVKLYNVEIKSTNCYKIQNQDLNKTTEDFENIKQKLYQDYILIDQIDYDSNGKIIRFQTNKKLSQSLTNELNLEQIFKYQYSSDYQKYIIKKLKGFSQGTSDRKLKYSMYEWMIQPETDDQNNIQTDKDGNIKYKKIEQITGKIMTPKYAFTRDLNQSYIGDKLESFSLTMDDAVKKQFHMMYHQKGRLDQDGFFISKTI